MTEFPIGSREYYREAIRRYIDQGVPSLGFIAKNGSGTDRVVNRYDTCRHGTIFREECEGCTDAFFTSIMEEKQTIEDLYKQGTLVGDTILDTLAKGQNNAET